MHMESPADAAIVPALHWVHAESPADAAMVPAEQAVQPVRPVEAVIVPAAQSVQAVAPARLENFPAGHGVHAAAVPVPTVEYEPTPHIPLPSAVLHPLKQYLPAGQGRHTDKSVPPVVVLYVPAGHGVHTAVVPVPNVEYEPALHVPLPAAVVQPARQYLPAGQDKQRDSESAPSSGLYFPASHCRHEYQPALEYDPAKHFVGLQTVNPSVLHL